MSSDDSSIVWKQKNHPLRMNVAPPNDSTEQWNKGGASHGLDGHRKVLLRDSTHGLLPMSIPWILSFCTNVPTAGVAELADTMDLGSSGATRRGSNPLARILSAQCWNRRGHGQIGLTMHDWTLDSWHSRPITHQPDYPDREMLQATNELGALPLW